MIVDYPVWGLVLAFPVLVVTGWCARAEFERTRAMLIRTGRLGKSQLRGW